MPGAHEPAVPESHPAFALFALGSGLFRGESRVFATETIADHAYSTGAGGINRQVRCGDGSSLTVTEQLTVKVGEDWTVTVNSAIKNDKTLTAVVGRPFYAVVAAFN